VRGCIPKSFLVRAIIPSASDCLASEIASFIPLMELADPSRATRIFLNLYFICIILNFYLIWTSIVMPGSSVSFL
jgi:hypothetical protein